MSKLCPGLGIDQDAAGIIVDVRGYETRAYDGEEQENPGFRASEKLHGHFSLTYGWSSLALPRTPQDKRRRGISPNKKCLDDEIN
jgi:hypothetical protein